MQAWEQYYKNNIVAKSIFLDEQARKYFQYYLWGEVLVRLKSCG